MDWKYLFTSFEGRINRKPFWLGLLALTIILWVMVIGIIMIFSSSLMVGTDPNNTEAASQADGVMIIPLFIVYAVCLWLSWAIYAKRWHDRGKSGWWTLIGLVPLIGPIWMIIECGFLRGTEGPNQYGDDPLA